MGRHLAHLSPDFTVVQVHQFVGMGACAFHFHGSICKLGTHDQPEVQVVRAAPPAIAWLRDLSRNGPTRAQTQISSGACPCDGVANGGGRKGVDKRRLSGSWPMTPQTTNIQQAENKTTGTGLCIWTADIENIQRWMRNP